MNLRNETDKGALCQNEYCKVKVAVWKHRVSALPHCHKFQELALVQKGYCVHCYRGTEAWLLPGDVFWIRPDEEHSYQIYGPTEIVLCRFFFDGISEEASGMLEKTENLQAGEWEGHSGSRQRILERQGIIYLNQKERGEISSLLAQIMKEDGGREEGLELVKAACLQIILIKLQRNRKNRTEEREKHKGGRKERIYEILSYAEGHLEERLAHERLAEMSYWSVGHFRSVFKDVTGMAPSEYLNRMRIAKSLEYMQKECLNVSQAAERVGFEDPGYYSKLFKKIIGYAPKNFKHS